MNRIKNYFDYIDFVKSEVEKGNRPKNQSDYVKNFKDKAYYEFHHIVPKCFGGTEMVPLTAREHLLAHYLLCYIYPSGNEHYKMLYAIQRLLGTRKNIKLREDSKLEALKNSKLIAKKKEELSREKSIQQTGKKFDDSFKEIQHIVQSNRDSNWCQNISDSKKGELNPNFKKTWYTNGKENILAESCPNGFQPGRIIGKINQKCRPILDIQGKEFSTLEEVQKYYNLSSNCYIAGILNNKRSSKIDLKYDDTFKVDIFPKEVIEKAKQNRKFTEKDIITKEKLKEFGNFPFESYFESELKKDFENLLNSKKVGAHNGNKIIGQFHKSIYKDRVDGYKSMAEAWKDINLMKSVIYNRFLYTDEYVLSPKDLRRGFQVSLINPHPSVFQPSFAKYLIKEYLNEYSEIFDPFSGYSGRMLGAIANNKKYIGQDIDSTHIKESEHIKNFLKLKNVSLTVKDIFESSGEYECLFTCPPYNLKEIWGADLKDLSCDQWIDECLKRFKCKKYLFIVDKTEKYKEFIVNVKDNSSHLTKSSEKIILI